MPDPDNERTLAALAEILDEFEIETTDHPADLRARRSGPPIAALIGAFDAGKSSLLKRICVDAEIPVPENLVISGEPSTTTVDEVPYGGWIIRDTPGLESENPKHGQAARRAALDADRTILMLLPNLFEEDGETAALVQELEPGTVDVILSRVDKAVMTANSENIARWSGRKETEVATLLARLGHPDVDVRVVAADPGGRVANRPVNADRFDATRGWDGVDAIRSLFDEPCAPRLRELATQRRLRLIIAEAVNEIDRRLAVLPSDNSESARVVEELTERLKAVDRWAADARMALREALLDAAGSGPSVSARSRIIVAADYWGEEWDRRLREAARDWRITPQSVGVDLEFARTAAGIELDAEDQPGALGFDGMGKVLKDHVSKLGGSKARLKKLEEDLAGYNEAKQKNKVRDYYTGEGGFSNLREKRAAEAELREYKKRQAGIAVAKAVFDFAREERTAIRAAAAARKEEAAAREGARALATTVARLLFDGAEGDGGGARDTFTHLTRQLEAVRTRFEDEADDRDAIRAGLDDARRQLNDLVGG